MQNHLYGENPLEVVPSFLSMTSAVFKIFNSPKTEYPLKEETISLLKIWLNAAKEKLAKKDPIAYFRVDYNQFTNDPGSIIKEIYAHFGLKVSAEYEETLKCISMKQRTYKSLHEYSLSKTGLDAGSLKEEFSGF